MALVRWDAARELDTLQNEMNRLFSSFFDTPTTGNGAGAARRWLPAMDLVETDEHFLLTADLPGMTESDVAIEVERNVLTIAGERKVASQAKKDGYYRIERASGKFARSLTLPEGVDAEGVTASFANGVLEVRIPKPVQAQPRRVQIGVAGAEPTTIEADTAEQQQQ
jgi:HSP20 family protein